MSSAKTLDSGFKPSQLKRLYKMCFDALLGVEETFNKKPNYEDALFLKSCWEDWLSGNWGKYIGGRAPSAKEIESKIRQYSDYLDKK